MTNDIEWARAQRLALSDPDGGGMVVVLRQNNIDPFASDKHNASLREQYGDTPYCAPDVDPETGFCDGGDAWPNCCEGHKFESHLEVIEGEALNDPNRCHWMIQIASGCPEPDSYEDTIQVVDCGATLTRFTAESGTRGWRCESGHHGWEFGSDEMQSEELEHEFQERRAEGHYA